MKITSFGSGQAQRCVISTLPFTFHFLVHLHFNVVSFQLSCVDHGVVPLEYGGLEKRRSLISAYRSLAITASTSEFEKLSTSALYIVTHIFTNPESKTGPKLFVEIARYIYQVFSVQEVKILCHQAMSKVKFLTYLQLHM